MKLDMYVFFFVGLPQIHLAWESVFKNIKQQTLQCHHRDLSKIMSIVRSQSSYLEEIVVRIPNCKTGLGFDYVMTAFFDFCSLNNILQFWFSFCSFVITNDC